MDETLPFSAWTAEFKAAAARLVGVNVDEIEIIYLEDDFDYTFVNDEREYVLNSGAYNTETGNAVPDLRGQPARQFRDLRSREREIAVQIVKNTPAKSLENVYFVKLQAFADRLNVLGLRGRC